MSIFESRTFVDDGSDENDLSSISCENTPAPASLEFLKSCLFLEFWSSVFLKTSFNGDGCQI